MAAGKILATFICLMIAWILFTGVTPAQLTPNFYQEMIVGGIVCALVAGLSYDLFSKRPVSEKLHPRKWAYMIAYIPYYIWAEIKAHLNVAYRVLHPGLPIEPAILRLPTDLRSDVGLTTLADSITMTPGTLTVEIDEEKPELYVHWISAGTLESKVAKEKVGKPLERFLKEGLG